MAQQKIGVILEVKDNGSMGISTKNAKELRAAIEAGQKASILLSRGIADPKKEEALKAQVALAKQLTRDLNNAATQSRATAKALATIGPAKGAVALGMGDTPGLERGSAAGNSRGGSRDFARQAQGMGGLVHVYATFAANIWAVSAAFEGLSKAYESLRLEESAEKLSTVMGASIKNLSMDLREASGYAVSFKESLQFAAMGTQAGLSAKQLNSLVKAAKGAANVLGRDVNDAINRMIRGTVKMEQEILDELGIFVRAKQAYKDYVAANNLASEEALTQSERVQAYADAVEKASKKYEEFAKIEDPFSKLKTTIADAGTELLNFANRGITPIVDMLSESKNLVEGLLLGGAAYLTKLAMPTLKNFTQSLFDTSALVAKARVARENEIASVTAQLENLKHKAGTVNFSKISTDFSKSLGVAINDGAITKAVSTALSKGAVDFDKNLAKSLQHAATGYLGSATKAGTAGDSASQEKWLAQAKLIATHEQEIVNKIKQRIAADAELTALLNKQSLTLQEQIFLQEKLVALEKETSLETRAGRRAARGEASSSIANKITAGGIGGILSMEAFKGLPEMFDGTTKGMTRLSKGLVVLETVAKVAARALTGLFSVLNWGLMLWLVWDLAIFPVIKSLGLVTDTAAQATEAFDRLAEQNKTTISSFEEASSLLAESDLTIAGKVTILQTLSNAVLAQRDAVEAYAKSLTTLGNMTTFDRIGESIKGIFTDNVFDKASKSFQETMKTFKAMDAQSSGTTDLAGAFAKSAQWAEHLLDIKKQIGTEETVLEKYEKNRGIYSSKDIENQKTKVSQLKEILGYTERKEQADKENLKTQMKLYEIMLKQKFAAAEIAAGIETGIKEIINIDSFDVKAYRFENQSLAQASSASKALTARSVGAGFDESGLPNQALKNLNVILEESQQNLAILNMNFAGTDSKGAIAFIEAYTEQIKDLKSLVDAINDKKPDEIIKQLQGKLAESSSAVQKVLEEQDKASEENKKKQSRIQADAAKADQDRLRALQRIEEWEARIAERQLNSLKLSEQQNTAELKYAKEIQGYLTKEQQDTATKLKLSIIEKEQQVDLAKLRKEHVEAQRGAKGDKKLLSSLAEMNTEMTAEIQRQHDVKLAILNIDTKLEEIARRRAEYEFLIYNPAKRSLDLKEAELTSSKNLGAISPEDFNTQKYALDLARLNEEQKKLNDDKVLMGGDSQKLQDQQAELDLKFKKLGIDRKENEELRARAVILGTLANQETLITSILEKQEGRGIFNTDLLNAQLETKLKQIETKANSTLDTLELQTLEIEKMNALYEHQLKLHEYMKRNLLELNAGQIGQVFTNEAQAQVDRFKAGMKDVVTGTFDAVYAGLDAGIDIITTKIMESGKINLKELIVTVRNTMAEEFRKMAADYMKLGVRQVMGDIISKITGKKTDLRSYEDKQIDLLTKIADNTAVAAGTRGVTSAGQAAAGLSGIFDYSSEDGKNGSYSQNDDGSFTKKVWNNETKEWETAAGQAGSSISSVLQKAVEGFGGLGSTIMTIFQGIGGGLMGILNPILNIFGITGFAGMGGSGGGIGGALLGGLGTILGGLDMSSIGSAIGSTMGMEGIGGWLSGLFFAKGGVMGQNGAVSLAKYSKGGVADRPQVAIYGEGAKNEAFVPLPDNRSIPVTLSGGGGGDNVNFSITVNDNSTVSTKQEGESSNKDRQNGYQEFSKLIAQRVREEMVNQKRPGGLLYGG